MPIWKKEFLEDFTKATSKRESLKIESYFVKKDETSGDFGSIVTFENNKQYQFLDATINPKNEFDC